MLTKYHFAALLLLLAACRKSPEERAKANALQMLRHQLGPGARADSASLKAYAFSKAQVSYFTSEVATYGDGYLVTYDATATAPGGPRTAKHAAFVADNDSAFFFLPFRHQAEFTRQFGVAGLPAPAAP